MNHYEEQIDRARRFYVRFKKINDGMAHDRPSDEYTDDICAFFQQCYHVKDHLINDPVFTKHSKAAIEAYVTRNQWLAICADICNGLKHLRLTKPPRSGAAPTFGAKHFSVKIGSHVSSGSAPNAVEPVWVSLHWIVDHNGRQLDAFQIATEAMNAWEQFIS